MVFLGVSSLGKGQGTPELGCAPLGRRLTVGAAVVFFTSEHPQAVRFQGLPPAAACKCPKSGGCPGLAAGSDVRCPETASVT